MRAAFALWVSLFASILVASASSDSPAQLSLSRPQMEEQLARYYTQSIESLLSGLLPGQTFTALTTVELDKSVNSKSLEVGLEESLSTLPGMIRPHLWANPELLQEKLLQLSHKKSVIVLTPADVKPETEELVKSAIRKRFRFSNADTLTFRNQNEFLRRRSIAGEKPFWGSALSWVLIVGALALVITAGVFGRGFRHFLRPDDSGKDKGKNKDKDRGLIKSLKKKTSPNPSPVNRPSPEERDENDVESVEHLLELIQQISAHDSESLSLAFSNLASRAELLPEVASVVALVGIGRLLASLPKVPGTIWARVGEAMAGLEPSEIDPHAISQFQWQLASEVAKVQRAKDEDKLLPKLESAKAGEVARSLRSLSTSDFAVAIAALPTHMLPNLVQEMSPNDILKTLRAVSSITSVKIRDLNRVDQALEQEGQDGNGENEIALQPAKKIAAVLSSVDASIEFQLSAELFQAQPRLIVEIAPYRLFPYHLGRLPDNMVSEALQSRSLDEIKQIFSALNSNLRARLLSLLTDKQQAIVEDSEGEIEGSVEALRSFLSEIHSKYFAGKPQASEDILGNVEPGAIND